MKLFGRNKSYKKADGYRGIWYYNQASNDEYVFKYSGGLGTYCAKHQPFAYYSKEVNKTFFCYGGRKKDKNVLLHMVSYYDHSNGTVPKPTILLNKKTSDAHDNPIIMVDDKGYIWIFSSSHGISRPSYIHKSKEPYSIESFERILKTNFSYPQCWFLKNQGFMFLHTKYEQGNRTMCFQTSLDGYSWSERKQLAYIEKGHYQVSFFYENPKLNIQKIGIAFNYHPDPIGLNARTNLYFIQTDNFGKEWKDINGEVIEIPIKSVENNALIHNYKDENLLVYLKDINYTKEGNPIILYITSEGYESGPKNPPRKWCTAYWNGKEWEINSSITSDSNYDMGSIYIDEDNPNIWYIIGPIKAGPQQFNPGGEVALYQSVNKGKSWNFIRDITKNSQKNHTYIRRPVNAHKDFYAFWADGNARKLSDSSLFFCNKDGTKVSMFPSKMENEFEKL